MSYTPTNWATGDVITAEKLNNMEGGIAGAGNVLVMTATPVDQNTATLDKKCLEIKNALAAGKSLMCRQVVAAGTETFYAFSTVLTCVLHAGGGCAVSIDDEGEPLSFEAASDNDYPTADYEK